MARDRVGKLIGDYDCWSCRKSVPVRRKADDAGGSLSATCPWCTFANVARRGSEHFDNLHRATRLTAAAEAPPAPAAAPGEAAPAAEASPPAPPKRGFAGPLFGGGRS